MEDPSRVGEARRRAAAMSAELGLNETEAGRVALIVTELGSNLVKHARHGRLLLATRQGATRAIEVLSLDGGPGIRNVAQSLQDGYSTGGTPGTGLGAVRRLADEFDLHSDVPTGSVVVARVHQGGIPAGAATGFRCGVAALCAPGETVCGDGWAIAIDGSQCGVLLADGLGHGPEAAEAAQAAVALFAAQPFAELKDALEQAHARLRITRGAALARATLDAASSTIRSVGAGNVVTRLVSGTANKTLLSQHGTVGVQVRRPEEIRTDWPAHAMVVLHSDGCQTRWPSEVLAPLLGRDPSLAAAVLLRDFCRGRDDATIIVVRRQE